MSHAVAATRLVMAMAHLVIQVSKQRGTQRHGIAILGHKPTAAVPTKALEGLKSRPGAGVMNPLWPQPRNI